MSHEPEQSILSAQGVLPAGPAPQLADRVYSAHPRRVFGRLGPAGPVRTVYVLDGVGVSQPGRISTWVQTIRRSRGSRRTGI